MIGVNNNLNVKNSTAPISKLTLRENILISHLIPSIAAVILYCFHFACDVTVAYRHYSEDNPVWASLTIFFIYLPSLGCFILTVSSWELWPEFEGCGVENFKWILLKISQHFFFSIWSMWRFAEKIFWSIEGVRIEKKESQKECLEKLMQPRTIELYFFLQGYLQAAPQILLQLHILMRNATNMEKATVDAQILCIIFSLARMSVITTVYQNFKTQKIAGRHYPWFKFHKFTYDTTIEGIHLRRHGAHTLKNNQIITERSGRTLERRRSSDFYEVPSGSFVEDNNVSSEEQKFRETSVVDGPKRIILREHGLKNDNDEIDFFNPRRLREIKGRLEDDSFGKLVSFCWWFCFLLSRMLTISSFAYFYQSEIIWILSSHFILTIAILIYDVRTDEVRRSKAIFFVFLGFVYLFCLIEFKIRFKKAKYIFFGFFAITFLENISMCLVWWHRKMYDIMNDFWFKFVFYIIVGSTLLSFTSMIAYIFIFRPKKVVVEVISEKATL